MSASSVHKNMIVTRKGVVSIPDEYIHNDFNEPIKVTWNEWSKSQRIHARLTATTIMEKRVIYSENIVCLKNGDKCLWFTRFEVECDKRRFHRNFGSRFMFQIPCVFAEAILLQFAKDLEDGENFALANELCPTPTLFRMADFPKCEYIQKMHNFTDRVFAMSFRPATSLLPEAFIKNPENVPKERIMLNRGEEMTLTPFNVFHMPEDCSFSIINKAVSELVKSPFASDYAALRTMRLVCKEFKTRVDDGAKKFLDEQHSMFEKIHMSQDVNMLLDQRNFLLDCFVDAMAMHRDCLNRSIFTLMRVRKFANPGARPGKKRKRENLSLLS